MEDTMPEKKRRCELDKLDDEGRPVTVSRDREDDKKQNYSDPGDLKHKTDRERSLEETDY